MVLQSSGYLCLCAAQVHGQVLAGWSLHQLTQAAQQAGVGSAGESSADTLRRLDTFLAANWQAYLEFAESMVQQVRSAQPSPAQRRGQPSARQPALPLSRSAPRSRPGIQCCVLRSAEAVQPPSTLAMLLRGHPHRSCRRRQTQEPVRHYSRDSLPWSCSFCSTSQHYGLRPR
jgi:hypothetical protein